MSLRQEELLSAGKRAMIGPAKCVMWLNRIKVKTYADFCNLFNVYGSEERMKVERKELKNKRIDWQNLTSYVDKVQESIT